MADNEVYIKALDFFYDSMKQQLLSGLYNEDSFDNFFIMLRKMDYRSLNKFNGSMIKPLA